MKTSITLLLILSICSFAMGQNCGNIGFEDGTLNGWVLSNGSITDDGSTKAIYGALAFGTINNEHIITTGGIDPKITVENIPQVAPGSKYSVRLGYTVQGGRYDRMSKTFLVTQENSLFQYRFAVVLQQDLTHAEYQKPGFSINVLNNTGNSLPCSSYDIRLQKNMVANGFKTQTTLPDIEIQYRNWTTGAMDLRAYIGQTLTVEVEVRGCTRMRHFGYAYFDAQCLKAEIIPLSNCPDADGNIRLKAPDGFERYTWSNGETGPVAKVKATLGNKVFVKVLPYSSLNNTCELQMDYQIQSYTATNTIDKTICEGDEVVVGKTAYKTSGTYTQTLRNNNCDSVITLNLKVNKPVRFAQSKIICEGDSLRVGNSVYKTNGVFITNIQRPAIGDIPTCDSIVTTSLIIDKSFTVSLLPNYEVKKEESIQLNAKVEPTGIYVYQWTPPDGLSCVSCPNPVATPPTSKTYTLKVSTSNSICPVVKRTRINVLSTFVLVPDIFTPNDDQDNDIFYVFGDPNIKQIKELSIFSRWGVMVFQNTNFPPSNPNHGWNGTYLGKPATADTYAYRIKAELETGEIKDFLGTFLLVR